MDRADPAVTWLLACDEPAVQALTLTDVLGLPAEDPEVRAARERFSEARCSGCRAGATYRIRGAAHVAGLRVGGRLAEFIEAALNRLSVYALGENGCEVRARATIELRGPMRLVSTLFR
jgi:hypothetical protein